MLKLVLHLRAGEPHLIPNPNFATLDYTSANSPMSAHCIVAARAIIVLHSGAGLTRAGHFKECFSDVELSIFEGEEINAFYYQVAAAKKWVNFGCA